ncbi:hypothetical protein MF672_039435 [Actinomadura sp. ATCC 31491]|uniref:DUF421 domain-containing protein n=1 Tax=Actinomadura luzonensis TaxID=2805427 RepID=A0ABT0G5D9_9ACTN|nr:hypothetical protein [Actinomadura luzonensis]MCK2219829.1 hypothetical protein [Actinomadura luzonensis]
MGPFRRLRADLSTGKNLEIYLTALIALTVGVLGVLSVVDAQIIGAATLATLALVAVNALGPRHQVTDLEARIADLNRLVEARLAGDVFLTTERKGLGERVGRARDVRLAGVTLSRTVRGHVEELRAALERGASVKVLLIDPEGTVPEEAARRSTIVGRGEVFEHRVTSTLYLLEELKGAIEVRFLPFVPAFGLVLLDPRDDDGVVHVELGTHSSAGRDPVFTLTPRRDHFWFQHFTAEFDRMWEVARPWREDSDT